MKSMRLNRRDFLKASAQVTVGASVALSSAAPSFAAPVSEARPLRVKGQKKALVFIMLDGGNDSFNMLVPRDNTHYREYAKTRSNLALEQSALLPLKGVDEQRRKFGFHPAMKELQTLFNQDKLACIANIGPMVQPVYKLGFYAQSAVLPVGLLSHADQFKHWQTGRPDLRINRGWFGHFADALQPNRPEVQVPMNVSLAGNNIMQNGHRASPYSITKTGSVGLVVNDEKNDLNTELLSGFESILNTRYSTDPFKETFISETRAAQRLHQRYAEATDRVEIKTSFSGSSLAQQLKAVAAGIKAADDLNLEQQSFFVRYIGWDHHDELLSNQERMLGILSQAMSEFQGALAELGIADKVVTFTGSDFGRTLTSNGNGTDHGWGGNTLVMGEPVAGGKVYGTYPALSLGQDNPLDVGNGVLIPSTPLDQFYAELALWFGLDSRDLLGLFPNLDNFRQGGKLPTPLGCLKETGKQVFL